MKKQRAKPTKPRVPKSSSKESKLLDDFERKHWPEIKAKIAAARASIAAGKGRKWDLDRFLKDAEKRRRSKLAAE